MAERRRLHRESRPQEWENLFKTQQDAITAIHVLLGDIAEDLVQAPHPSERDLDPLARLVRIDRARSNRVLLIEGGRGAGKTSVLVTLVDLWRRTAKRGVVDHPHPEVAAALRSLAVVPTSIIDLQPLPESAHLMLHVCGHLRSFATLGSRDASGEQTRDATATETTWEAFARGAAKVWQPRNERSSRLTPEDLAEELADVEVERLELDERFHKFVDALVAELGRQREFDRPILLVVPIDDADLNPWRSLEVLDLIRWLRHPQVAFVLAGHSELFRQVIHAETLGNLARPLRGLRATPARVEEIYGEKKIKLLARDIYNKLIPPSHRARIYVSPSRDFLKRLEPTLRAIDVSIDAPMLRRLNEDEPANLFEYLRDAGLAPVLPSELRRLFHFAELVELPEPTATGLTRIARAVLELVGDAYSRSDLTDDPFQSASAADLQQLATAVKFTIPVTPRTEFPRSGAEGPRFDILAENAAVSASVTRDGEETVKVPVQLAHGLMLHVETRAARLKLDTPGLPSYKVVSCETPLRRSRQSWPIPGFRRHLEQRAFLRYTNRLLVECAGDDERFTAWYLGAVIQLDQASGEQLAKQDAPWVLSRAAELFRRVNQTRACELVGIAAPEFGVSFALAARWLGLAKQAFAADWKSLLPIIRRQRRRWLGRRSTDAVPKELAEHPWHAAIEAEPSPTSKPIRKRT